MLLQFSVENYLSFRDKAVLSAVPAPGVEHAAPMVLRDGHGHEALRALVVYGANASGKSNLIKALAFARDVVVSERGARDAIGVKPFALDAAHATAPSQFEFEFEFAFEGESWSFGFVLTARRVEAEWLHRRRSQDAADELVYERELKEEGEGYEFTVGPGLAEGDHALAELIGRGTRANQLFLAEAEGRGIGVLDTVTRWFREGLGIFGAEIGTEEWLVERLKGAKARAFAGELLERAGTGAGQIGFRFEVHNLNEIFDRKLIELEKSIMRMVSSRGFIDDDDVIALAMTVLVPRLVLRHGSRPIEGTSPSAPHQGFSLSDESDGTVRLLYLASLLYGEGKGEGADHRTLCMDEIERSLHPNLSRFVLEAMLSAPEAGAAQFVFTTHDTGFLDLKLLPRDAVWFTEKDGGGGTHLYSLAEFNLEQITELSGDWEHGYLHGRFGAVPFLGDPKKLGWEREPSAEPEPEPAGEVG